MTIKISTPARLTVALVGAQLAVAAPFVLAGVFPTLVTHTTSYATSGVSHDVTSPSVPGCYDDTGAMVAPSPCYVVPNGDGTSDVYTVVPDERAVPVVTDVSVVLSSASSAMPSCRYEDGNDDGQPCMWYDTDTGSGYYVESDGYR